MSALLQPAQSPYWLDEYFALELSSDKRHEYWNGEIVCMAGGSDAHGQITMNVLEALALRLRGGDCRPRTEGTAIRNPLAAQAGQPPYVYPDASVVCGGRRIDNVRGVDTLVNPSLIVEVLSESTAERDRNQKLRIYQAIPTVRDYLIVASETVQVTHWRREADADWTQTDHADRAEEIRLATANLALPVSEIYADVF
jgi:Uma2 family endonuclease